MLLSNLHLVGLTLLAGFGPLGCRARASRARRGSHALGHGLRGAGTFEDGPPEEEEDRFEGGWVSDVGQAPSSGSGGGTVLVVKTYARFTPWKIQQIQRYADQLGASGVPVVVLRDASALRRNGQSLGDGGVRKRWLILGSGLNVQLCDVSWQAALAEWGPEAIVGYTSGGGGTTRSGQGVHNQYEALWWRYCRPTGSEEHVWFVEDDAFFNGDVSRFLGAYADVEADLVSSSFRIAGARWWNFQAFNRSLSQGLKLFGAASGVVSNVSPLPPLDLSPCGDGSGADDSEGLVFRQDVVERYSARLFGMLDSALISGLLAPAEAFLSTLCAGGAGLPPGERCAMLDWAPVAQRDSGRTWASPLWCWGGTLRGRQCNAGWGDKWIHPVKTTRSDAMACHAHAS